jgi:hypothetical protein
MRTRSRPVRIPGGLRPPRRVACVPFRSAGHRRLSRGNCSAWGTGWWSGRSAGSWPPPASGPRRVMRRRPGESSWPARRPASWPATSFMSTLCCSGGCTSSSLWRLRPGRCTSRASPPVPPGLDRPAAPHSLDGPRRAGKRVPIPDPRPGLQVHHRIRCGLRRERHASDQDAGPVAAGELVRRAVRGDASPRVPGPRADPRRAASPQCPGRVRPALQRPPSAPEPAARTPQRQPGNTMPDVASCPSRGLADSPGAWARPGASGSSWSRSASSSAVVSAMMPSTDARLVSAALLVAASLVSVASSSASSSSSARVGSTQARARLARCTGSGIDRASR